MDSLFGPKKPTVTKENMEKMAALRAKYDTKKEFGRNIQSRAGNILYEPGQFKRTNAAAIRMKELNEKYKMEMGKFIGDLGKGLIKEGGSQENVKNVLEEVKKQLETAISEQKKSQVGGGNITITISVVVAKILLMIIKVILFSIALLFAVGIAILGSESPELPTGILSFDPFSNKSPRKVEEYQGGRRSTNAERQNKTRRNRSRK